MKLELSCDEPEPEDPPASFLATMAAAVEAARPVSISGADAGPAVAGLEAFFTADFFSASLLPAGAFACAGAASFFAAGPLDDSDFFSFAMCPILSGDAFATNACKGWILLAETGLGSNDNGVMCDDDDPMGPPKEPCECWCLQCERVFMSSEMWFQRIVGAPPDHLQGHWMCPTPNCGGTGFTFDIFPTDPRHPANLGWVDDEDDDGGEYDPELDYFGENELESEYDPEETKWKQLDEDLGDCDDDLEGEEWKHGLEPGERPAPSWMEQACREREEQERRFDEPDERPREIEWVDRTPRGPEGPFADDDIPF